MQQKNEQWGSMFGFIMASAGSAVGLGNIWRFPYIVGKNGGAAFVLVYLITILLVGLPIMIAEMSIGRASQSDPIGAFLHFSKAKKRLSRILGITGILLAVLLFFGQSYGIGSLVLIISASFFAFGWICAGISNAFIPILILSYYTVIGGWIFKYLVMAIRQQLTFTTQEAATNFFVNFVGNGLPCASYALLFLFVTGLICFFGVSKGIEAVSKIMMPLLLLLLCVLIIRSVTLPGAKKGLEFFCKPDFSNLTMNAILVALGHAFFSMSLGMGILITYGGYLPRNRNIITSAGWVAFFDTLVSIMAGFAIFPAVFAMNFEPAAGPSLIFNVLPATFNMMPGGWNWMWNAFFFLLMSIAAVTSSISLMESGVSTLMKQFKLSRPISLICLFIFIMLMTVPISYSILNWNNMPWMGELFTKCFGTNQGDLLDQIDNFCSNWMLPVNGLCVCIYVVYIWGSKHCTKALYRAENYKEAEYRNDGHRFLVKQLPVILWSVLIRYVAPVLLIVTFLYATGYLKKIIPGLD